MNQIKTAKDIKQLGTILSVWAHPDDESFTAAGIMASALSNGQNVACVTATKGEAGVQDESRWPSAKLGEIREQELNEALKQIGITNHHFLGYHDGECKNVSTEEAVGQIKKFIEKYKPDTILTFGPDGLTGHPDHQTVSKWVTEVTRGTDIKVYQAVVEEGLFESHMKEMDQKFNIYFNIDKPPVYKKSDCNIAFELTGETLAKKKAALLAMPSQTEAMFKNTPKDVLQAILREECFVLAS